MSNSSAIYYQKYKERLHKKACERYHDRSEKENRFTKKPDMFLVSTVKFYYNENSRAVF